jgi:hypothetical protein
MLPPPEDHPDVDELARPEDRNDEAAAVGAPPASGWAEARRHWEAALARAKRGAGDDDEERHDGDDDDDDGEGEGEDEDEPVGFAARSAASRSLLGVRTTEVDRLPPPVRLLPAVHRGGEIHHLNATRIRGREAIVFEHVWSIGLIQIDLKVRSVMAAVEMPDWPSLRITPRRGLIRRPRRGELQLDHEPFTRRFRVVAEDEDFAILLLTPEVQAWLADGPGISWFVAPGGLAMVRPGRLRPVREDVEASLVALETLIDLIPAELALWNA